MKAVVATDLSAASEATIESETCLRCIKRIGIEEIHLVTVVPSNVYRGMPGIDFEKRRRQALDRYSAVIEDAGFAVEAHVVRGTPHRRIIGIAGTIGASLTIVGSRGKSPLENRVIGSTARNLARTTVTPLLVNRIEREVDEPDVKRKQLFRRMLFATDFSANAERAFRQFEYLQGATKEVMLVHVQTPKDPERSESPETLLAEEAAELEAMGIEVETTVRNGDPATEILAAEEAYDPATTMIGSRGHSRLRRLLIGSVSEDIVTHAQGNVLLVPPERDS